MPRRAAAITQADVARTIRAAKQAGAAGVEVRPGGTVVVVFDPQLLDLKPRHVEPEREIVL